MGSWICQVFKYTNWINLLINQLLIYKRHLTAELTQEWDEINNVSKDKATIITTTTDSTNTVTETQDVEFTVEPTVAIAKEDLLNLAKEIVPFFMNHNAEADACDLLMEIEHVELLLQYVEKYTYQRVCLYCLG